MGLFPRLGRLRVQTLILLLTVICTSVSCAQATAPAAPAPASVRAPVLSPEHPELLHPAILAAAKAGDTKIVIPPGVYRIPAAPFPPGKDASHLRFEGLKNFEIDATGCTFIFTDRWQHSMIFLASENVTIRGATFKRATIPFTQGKIVDVDPRGNLVTVRIDPGYPSDLMDRQAFPVVWFVVFDPVTRQPVTGIRADSPPKIEQIAPDTFRVKVEPLHSTGVPVQVGQRVACRGAVFNDLVFSRCKDMKAIDITVERGAGFVFGERGGQGNSLWQNCKVIAGATPEGCSDEPLYASNADGFHSSDARHGPSIINCYFERLDDDAIAIHGTYHMVLEASGNRIVAQRMQCPGTPSIGLVGDTLRFYDKRLIAVTTAKITQAKVIKDYQPTFPREEAPGVFRNRAISTFVELTLDSEPAIEPMFLLANENEQGSNYIVRGCTIRNSFARGIIGKGSNALIENNTFENLTRAAYESNTETSIWSEADYARDVIIRNNTIRRVSLNRKPGLLRHPGAINLFSHRDKAYITAPGGHRNILIENNTIEDVDGPNMLITSAQGVIIRNNTFVRPMQQEKTLGKERGVDPATLIWVEQSEQVQITNNKVTDPGPFYKQQTRAETP